MEWTGAIAVYSKVSLGLGGIGIGGCIPFRRIRRTMLNPVHAH